MSTNAVFPVPKQGGRARNSLWGAVIRLNRQKEWNRKCGINEETYSSGRSAHITLGGGTENSSSTNLKGRSFGGGGISLKLGEKPVYEGGNEALKDKLL